MKGHHRKPTEFFRRDMMADSTTGGKLDAGAVALLTVLCLIWGLNAIAMKYATEGIAPIFCAGLRSLIATVCLMGWMMFRRIALFPGHLKDGMIIGLLFGAEFGLLYVAILYTTVSSAWILLYTAPLFHALGAHFFLTGDRISATKSAGLILSFAGIVVLLSEDLGLPTLQQFYGDLMAVGAAALWALTTVYVKRRLVAAVSPYHTLFYQTLFSIPLLFLLSFAFQETQIQTIDWLIFISMAYQGILVAFVSYLGWFFLVHSYAVSRLSAFTFLTPVFATIAGIGLLKEPLTLRLIISLVLVSIGLYIMNQG
jgi:drug/metabolite transporter (DMT)-like permease